jgi:hypothetical protein
MPVFAIILPAICVDEQYLYVKVIFLIVFNSFEWRINMVIIESIMSIDKNALLKRRKD